MVKESRAATLEELIAERKALDKKIRELQNPKYEVDGAKMVKRAYGGKRQNIWVVTLEEIYDLNSDKPWQYKQVVAAQTREDAISGINHLIVALTRLYEKVRQEG